MWAALSAGVADLQQELDTLSARLQEAMLEGDGSGGGGAGGSDSAGGTAPAATATPAALSAGAPAGTGLSNAALLSAAELESRVTAAEMTLGLGVGGTWGAGAGVRMPDADGALGARLASVEAALAAVGSASALDALGVRAERTAASLSALSGAATAAGAGGSVVMGSARLARAAEAAEELLPLATSLLPGVASRLLSLGALHAEAALFARRLAAVEACAARCEASLEEDRELLREAATLFASRKA